MIEPEPALRERVALAVPAQLLGHVRERALVAPMGLAVANVKDGSDEQRPCGLRPVLVFKALALRVDEHGRDVLHVGDFVRRPQPNLGEWIEACGLRIPGIEANHALSRALLAPAGGPVPVLAFDVEDDRRLPPTQERRNHEPDALPASGRRKRENVLGSVMPEVVRPTLRSPRADVDAALTDRAEEPRAHQLSSLRPARRTVSVRASVPKPRQPRKEKRHRDGKEHRRPQTLEIDLGQMPGPPGPTPRRIDPDLADLEPRMPKGGLTAEDLGEPLGDRPLTE